MESAIVVHLAESYRDGELAQSRLAPLLIECCQMLDQKMLSTEYDFALLETAIRDADHVFVEAEQLTAKTEGRESAVRATRMILVALGKAVVEGVWLRTLFADVAETILANAGINAKSPLSRDKARDDLYSSVLWGPDAVIEDLLPGFCDE